MSVLNGFDTKAKDKHIKVVWTPIVIKVNNVVTTNYWHDPVRDRLLVGEPDRLYFDKGKVNVPQGPWGIIADVLTWDIPSYYPEANRERQGPELEPG